MPKQARKFTTRVGISLLVLFSFTRCAHTPQNAPDLSKYDQIVIVGTNDFHGYLRPVEGEVGGQKVIAGGAEWFAGYVRILERKYGDHLVLLDAGDIFQGTMESNSFRGKSTLDFYNLLPYRAAAVGNHEFDYGPLKRNGKDRLGVIKQRMSEAKFPFLQANIFMKGTDKLWREKNLQPTTMIQVGATKIGILGLTTTSTRNKTLPQNVVSLDFRDLAPAALAAANDLRARGANLVLITTHEGGEHPGEPIYTLLHSLPKGTVDAVVSGHSHTEIHEMVNGVPVIQAKTRGVFFGRIDLFVEKATGKIDPSLTRIHGLFPVCGTWFAKTDSCDLKATQDAIAAGKARESDFLPLRKPAYEGVEARPDLPVRKVLAPYFAEVDKSRKEVLAGAVRDFEWYPSGESEMGFLFTRAFQWKFPEAKVFYFNGGGIRRRFVKGPITYGDLFEVHPFDNYATLVKMNGKQLRALIEVGTSGEPVIPTVLGVRVKYHNDARAEDWRDLNGDGKKDKWERNRVVSLSWENGVPVKDTEEFWLATIDYLVSGGDNNSHVFGPIPASRKRFTDLPARDLVADYLRAHKGISLPVKDEIRIQAVN